MAGGFLPLLNPAAKASDQNKLVETGFLPDLDIELKATAGEVSILPGKPTGVWRYKAKILKGDSNRLIELPDSYLGPIIKANKGDKIRVRFINQIPEDSIIHWHGLHIPATMDGHPRYVIPQGRSYIYEFEVKNRAGTYWYHPHPHGRTGPQVYGGLAGLFLVSDDEEKAAGLPSGEYDIPLVIQDRTFDINNKLVYLSGHMMDRMNGFLGNRIMVNGNPDFILPAATRAYRFRILNGSNSRIYKLGWQDGSPLTIIGTDGGLLEKPVRRRYAMLAPGERIELWADFSQHPVGTKTSLVSLPFDDGTRGGMGRGGRMGRGMMGRGRRNDSLYLPNGAGFSIFKIHVNYKDKTTLPLPTRLSTIEHYRTADAVNAQFPRTFRLLMNHMNWTINGRTFRMTEVASDEKVRMNTLEVWEFINEGGGMGMMGMSNMPHPIHLHGKQFQVLERSHVMHEGYIDNGWKDTVLLMPGERIKILVRFEDYPGLFLYHCHNLEHEDMGMMCNYLIEDSAASI
jgi:FtsP/CotA-like multicopper oxidase with cupredoxin domain